MKKIAADINYRMLKRASSSDRAKAKKEAIRQVQRALAKAKDDKTKEERKRTLESFGITEINNGNSFVVKLQGGRGDEKTPGKITVLKSELNE